VDSLEDPTKKEVAELRKKIESVDKELKPLQQLCVRKVNPLTSLCLPIQLISVLISTSVAAFSVS
jgi:hypothetical protein